MIKPQVVNGKWRSPVIGGRQKAELKKYFKMSGVPWIYETPRPEVHVTSAYNRKPKGHKHELNAETRIAVIRKALSTQDDRLEKLRQDRYDNMPLKTFDKTMFLILKSLKFEESGGSRSKSAKRAAAASEKQDEKDLGIEQSNRKSPAKKGKGASKGGNLNKKTRAAFDLAGASIRDMEEGKGASTNAAMDLQKKKTKDELTKEKRAA